MIEPGLEGEQRQLEAKVPISLNVPGSGHGRRCVDA
jgi:hypothetical protein